MNIKNKGWRLLKHQLRRRNAAAVLSLLGILLAQEARCHTANTNSTRFKDQNDMGCHMSPGAAGAPASGAAGSGGNQANCPPCKSASGISRWWINSPYENLHIADEPLSYFTSSGQPMVFRWLYKQRYKLPELD